MTGFGAGSAPLESGRIVAEIRAVNGRFLDVRVRMPQELTDLTSLVEGEARKWLSRGRCDLTVRAEGGVFAPPTIDKDRARSAYRALVELRDEVSPGADVPFAMLSAVPDLFTPSRAAHPDLAEQAVRVALAGALEGLDLMRRTEGKCIADDMQRRLDVARSGVRSIDARAPDLTEIQARKLKDRLARISVMVLEPPSEGQSPIGDPARIEQEIVILLERCDISEEVVRLSSHLEQMASYLHDDEPVGRKLDFLLQEMAREINTIGAKSQDLRIAHLVIELKAEIERMREQVQNVE